jgi:hypothetical protein
VIFNQSLAPIGHIFSELSSKKSFKSIDPNVNPETMADEVQVMEDTSDIITQRDALQIKNHLPGECQMVCWQLYYSRYRHGKSYKT